MSAVGSCMGVRHPHPAFPPTSQAIVGLFASKDTVNNFNAFDNWWDTKATVALAKVGAHVWSGKASPACVGQP